MTHRGIIAAIIVFALIIVGMFVFAFLKKSEFNAPTPSVVTPPPASPYDSITRIDGKHFTSGTAHTIVGEVLMPTPCDLLDWTTSTNSSGHVSIDFTVINSTDSCIQTVTPQKFYVQFTAPLDVPISATLNGRTVILNLIPALPGESPDTYEYAPKG